MGSISVESLKSEQTFYEDLMIDNNFMLLPRGAVLSDEIIKSLKIWGFEEINGGERVPTENSNAGTVQKTGYASSQDYSEKTSYTETSTTNQFSNESSETSPLNQNQNKDIKESLKTISSKMGNTEKTRIEAVKDFYNEFLDYIEKVFTIYATQGKIDQTELEYSVKELCVFIKENRRYILRINPSYDNTARSYLLNHTMRTTVLSIAIAQQMHMPFSQMTELGVTCILHEIGMLQIPPQLYMSTKKLTSGERLTIMKHTILGYKIIRDLDFPQSVLNGVIEHHEKENGTGYPRHITGSEISNFAKIISVACSFEAITSPRSYKPERTAFDAMVEMLKNENNQYNPIVIKALLYSVSLYPIGAYVYLNNGKIGIVNDVNPDNPKCPFVQMLLEKEKDGSPKTILTDGVTNKIVRVLTIKEQQDVIKAMEEVEKNQQTPETAPANDEPEQTAEKETVAEEKAGSKKIDGSGNEEIDINFFN